MSLQCTEIMNNNEDWFSLLDVFSELVGLVSRVNNDFSNAIAGQELKCVLDNGCVCQWK